MSRDTHKDYERIYEKFCKEYLPKGVMGNPKITPKNLEDGLKAKARAGCSKNYWYRLKTAIKYMQAGHKSAYDRMDKVKWPSDGVNNKTKFAKRVKADDFAKFHQFLKDGGHQLEADALYLVKHTGMRPHELFNSFFQADGTLYVEGAKKTADGKRGADRQLSFTDKEVERECKAALKRYVLGAKKKDLNFQTVGPTVQKRISKLTRQCFNRRKSPPTLKSFRHQFGSDVKGMIKRGELSREEAAYMLGHQSTDSMDKYGNVKTASESAVAIKASANENAVDKVRTPAHTEKLNEAMENLTFAEIQAADGNKILAAREVVKAEKAESNAEKSVEAKQERKITQARGFDDCLDFGM